MPAADTNVLVRLLTADDPDQTARAEALLSQGRLWISTVVLVETVWVLLSVYSWNKDQVLAMLRSLVDSRDFSLQDAQILRSSTEIYAESQADFADCLALELARSQDQLPFATFDKKAAALPGAIGL